MYQYQIEWLILIFGFFFFNFLSIEAVSLSQNVPTATASVSPASVFSGGASPSTLSALVSQHRLLELSRFGLRGYDLAQHMLSQQGAVSKLLGKRLTFILNRHQNSCRKWQEKEN